MIRLADTSERQTTVWPRAVYVHVPFCLHHCGYCDFTLVANRDQLIPEYLSCLRKELQWQCDSWSGPLTVDTIYVGGGTPTHLSPCDLQSTLQLIRRYFQLAPGGEYSIEANPDGLCDERLGALQQLGVNRLSLGVQSFDDDVLRTLERRHTGQIAESTIQRAERFIPNISVDLIFGVPEQTMNSWKETLSVVSGLPVRHVSTYGLTYETGTPFFRRERTGELTRAPEELERCLYLEAIDFLTGRGWNHYEVSSFAVPGFESRHNQVYWAADEYFAFGPGAARYIGGVRSTNCRSVVRWLKSWKAGKVCIDEQETLTQEEKSREAIMLALRTRRGLHIPEFEERFRLSIENLCGDVLARYVASGMLQRTGDFLRLTRDGLLLADTVVADFL